MAQRFLFLSAALTVAFCASGPLWAARNELIPETTLARSGLTRPWFAQVELDQGRARVSHVTLREGVLYVQTDAAMVHAIDAETGRTLWSKQAGKPNRPSMPLDAKGDLVAVINGSQLYLLNHTNGDVLDEKTVPDAPGGGPALSAKRVYVPGVMGMVTAYRLPSNADKKGELAKNEKESAADKKTPPETQRKPESHGGPITPPLFCKSFGRALVQPLVTRDFVGGEYVVWPTDRGNLNLARVERATEESLALKYRMETGAPIVARPAYLPPDPKVPGDAGTVFAASCDGFVYAIQEETGDTLWRFSTGEPILRSPAVIDQRVYVTTELGGMYCLDAKTSENQNLWWAENVMQFVAASKARVYVVDRIGRLRVLSAASGAQLDSVPTENVPIKLANTDTDRIYLVSDGGLVQCLREVEQTEPIMHGKDRKEAAKAETQPPVVEQKEKPAKKEHAAPKPPTTPKEKPAPKERPPKKTGNKAAGAGPLGGPGNNAKPPKGTKPPANNNTNPF